MFHRIVLLSLLLIARPGLAQENLVRMAGEARVDIRASASVGSLTEGSAAMGGGFATRMNWLSADEQSRSYVVNWPIAHFRWTEVAFSFLPASNGTIQIDLAGPWTLSTNGLIYRQEVLWDALVAEGSALVNGSFELGTGWINPWGGAILLEQAPPPVDGTNCLSVWHDRRAQATLSVTGGQPVVLRGWARARLPDDYVDQPRITDTNSPAHQAARRFMRGVNFSNFFEAPAGEDWGGGPLVAADFEAVAAQGFDHVRLPVSWNYHAGPGPSYVISNAFLARVDAVVTGLLARQVNVLLNLHHFNEFYAAPAAWTNALMALWDQLGAHYSNYPAGLAFEILNEPHDQATTALMNEVYATLIPRLRQSNPQRTIFVGPGSWNSIDQLSGLRLPGADSNLVVTVHNYQPFYFTHQGATWTGSSTATTNLVYPGPPPSPVSPHPAAAGDSGVVAWLEAYNTQPLAGNPCSSNAFDASFRLAADWGNYYGRPVHVGEFGAFSTADAASRARFYREMRESMDRHGLGWAAWDWKSGFHYWQRSSGAPAPGLREAFFPAPAVKVEGAGLRLRSESAVGKKIVVQQSDAGFSQWTGIYTQVQLVPSFDYTPELREQHGAFRLVWEP